MTYCRRCLETPLSGLKSANKVRIIFGARQTGKTMLMRHLIRGESSKVFNLQDIRLRQQFEGNPSSFREELRALGKDVGFVGIDEVQKVPALLEEVQLLYDESPSRWQFFLTGSSARKLRGHSANLLPGRCHVYHLYPAVRVEEAGYSGTIPSSPVPEGSPFRDRSLTSRLMFGNLPGVAVESHDSAAATLQAYVENYIEEEIRREGLVRNVGSFHTFLRLVAMESGGMINVANLSQESGVPASTLKLYYQVLIDTFVGYWMHPYAGVGRKRLLRTPRFYLFDLGVRNAAARLPLTGTTFPPELGGRLLEHWVGVELVHRAGYAGPGHEVSFWATAGGAEVDFVWQSPSEHIPIEVKWTQNPSSQDIRHVESFLDSYPKKARRGLLVCQIPRARRISDRTTAIPWREL